MEATIGDAAGHIWVALQTHGPQSLPALRQKTGLTERLLSMGIGWLAREGKLTFVQERGVLKVHVHEA